MFPCRRTLHLLFRGLVLVLVLVLVLAFALVSVASAQTKEKLLGVALVIGESDYTSLAPLPNPGNDAAAVAGMLDRLGFEVTERRNRDAVQLRRDLERFVEDAA